MIEEYTKPESRGRPRKDGMPKGYFNLKGRYMNDFIFTVLIQVKARDEEEAKKKVLRLARKNYVYIVTIQKK